MKIDKGILELLYRSFDDDLTDRERAKLEKALASSEALKVERERIASMREAVSASRASGFGYMFTERVMKRVRSADLADETTPAFFESLSRVFRPVAIAGLAAAVALMVYNIVESRHLSFSAALGVPEVTLEEVLESPLDSVLEGLS
jgi:anti-sigma factor RsiW